MFKQFLAVALFSLATPAFAQLDYVQFSKEDAANMPIESAIEVAESYLAPSWLDTREPIYCSNLMASLKPGGPKFVQKSMRVQLDWLTGIVKNENALLYTIQFKSGEMVCIQATTRPVESGGVDIASAMWRLAQEPDDTALKKHFSAVRQSLANAPAKDQFLELATDFESAQRLIDAVMAERQASFKESKKRYDIPAEHVAWYRAVRSFKKPGASSTTNFTGGINYANSSSVAMNLIEETKVTTLENPRQIRVNVQTSQYEIPVGREFFTDDMNITLVESGAGKGSTELPNERSDIQRSGQAGYFPAELGQPIVFRQTYTESGGVLPDKSIRQYRACIPMSVGRFELAGEGREVLNFECASARYETQISTGIVGKLNKLELEQVSVDLKTGMPLYAEGVLSHLFSGNASRYISEYRVTALADSRGRGTIGILFSRAKPMAFRALGADDAKGMIIQAVIPGGPGYLAGLRAGDVIRSVAGVKIDSAEDVIDALQGRPVGSMFEIQAISEHQLRTFDVFTGSAKAVFADVEIGNYSASFRGALLAMSTLAGHPRLVVNFVIPGSNAAKYGLRAGDALTHLMGVAVPGAVKLGEVYNQYSGQPMRVKLLRNNDIVDVTVPI